MTRLHLQIEGMTCAMCAQRVERRLGKLAGVRSVKVNLASEKARLEIDDAQVGLEQIEATLKALGFGLVREKVVSKKAFPWTLALAWLATLPLVLNMLVPHQVPPWLQWLLASFVFLGPGRPLLVRGARAALSRSPDMNTLVALGSGAAYLEGSWQAWQGQHHSSLEACAVVLAMVLLGKHLEGYSKGKAGQALQQLLDMTPKTATLEDGRQVEVASLWPGDRVRLLPGECVPADGQVVSGQGWVDESLLTGEPLPVSKGPGDGLTGGTLVGASPLLMQVERVGEETRLAQLARIVEEAQLRTAPIQNLADRVVAHFVPVMLGLALLTGLYWLSRGLPQAALQHAVSVLVVACPCALGLAVPTALLVGSGRAAQLGILFRSARALQELGQAQELWMDKTGTLTQGKMRVVAGDDQTLALAAAIEQGSEHPLAAAIIQAAHERQLSLASASDWKVNPGRGVEAKLEGVTYSVARAQQPPSQWQQAGYTCVSVFREEQALGDLALADVARPEAAEAIAQLRQLGLQAGLLSGDQESAVSHLAKHLGIERWRSQVTPEQKAEQVQAALFVGDGLNDAPALASAALGVAVSGATDLALESAPIVLLRADLRLLPRAIVLSRRVRANIWQNLGWAFVYNLVLLPWAALGELPAAWAGTAMATSSLFVVGNSLRLRRA